MNKKVKYLLQIAFCILLLVTPVVYAYPPPGNWKTALISQISTKLKHQIAENKKNILLNHSYKNSYLIHITPNWNSKKNWTDERGQENLRIFSESELEDFDNKLRKINTAPTLGKAKAVYVVIINDWKLLLETTIAPGEKITNLAQFKAQKTSLEQLRQLMDDVPDAAINEVSKDKKIPTICLYLFAKINVFDNPTEQTAKPKRYYYQGYSSEIRPYLNQLKNLSSLRDFVGNNIDKIGNHFTSPQASALNLQTVYTIDKSDFEQSKLASLLAGNYENISTPVTDNKQSVYDYTGLIDNKTRQTELEKLCQDLRTPSIRGGKAVFVKVFYTDYRMPDAKLAEIAAYSGQLGSSDLMLWVHLEADNKVKSNIYFGKEVKDKLSKDYLDRYIALQLQTVKVYHKFTSMPVKCVAWLAGGISNLLAYTRIPRKFWDPEISNYASLDKTEVYAQGDVYTPLLCILYYVSRSSTTYGGEAILQAIKSDEDDFIEKIKEGLGSDFANKQREFALVCGLWNGVVGEITGLTDGVKLVADLYTDPPDATQTAQFLAALLEGKLKDALLKQLKERYNQASSSQYQLLFYGGSDGVAVATLFIGIGELTAPGKFAKIAQVTKYLNLTELLSLTKYIKTLNIAGKLEKVLAYGKYYIQVIGAGARYEFKLLQASGQSLELTARSELEKLLNLDFALQIIPYNGKSISVWTEKGYKAEAIIKIEQVVENADNTRLLTLQSADNELHLALMIADVTADLQNAFPGISQAVVNNLSELVGIEKLLSNNNLVKVINELGDRRNRFFESLSKENSLVKPPDNLLKQHLGELNEQHIEVWKKLDEWGNDNKKVDFDFLEKNKNFESEDDLRKALSSSSDDLVADLIQAGMSIIEKNIIILKTTEPKMAEALQKAFQSGDRSIFREETIAALKQVFEKDWIGNKITASQVREGMIKEFNEQMGKLLNYDELMNLTEKSGLDLVTQQSSRGSMFESWFEHKFTQELGLKGKYSDVFNGERFVIDSYYLKTINGKDFIIGVELKHIDGIISGETLIQLNNYGQIVKEYAKTRIIKIEYIFSKFEIASKNKNTISQAFGLNKNFYTIYYIDTYGIKQILP